MDNFYFVNVKPSIDRAETASVKDAIFKRAREKAQAITEEKSENYTAQVQNDVMDMARENIKASPMNPFKQFMDNLGIQNGQIEPSDPLDKIKPKSETEQPKVEQVFTQELKRNIESVSDKTFSDSVKEETMNVARQQFRSNLNATLNFLNTQAAIQMAKNTHSKIRIG